MQNVTFQIDLRKFLLSKKLKILCHIITDCRSEQIFGTFYEKILQKKNQKEFRKKRVISRKGDKPYVKWKGYENSCNSWIDKK